MRREKRQYLRVEVPYSIKIRTDEGQELTPRIENLSAGGARVITMAPVRISTTADIELYLPEVTIACRGRIVWANEVGPAYGETQMRYALGIEFYDLRPQDRKIIKKTTKKVLMISSDRYLEPSLFYKRLLFSLLVLVCPLAGIMVVYEGAHAVLTRIEQYSHTALEIVSIRVYPYRNGMIVGFSDTDPDVPHYAAVAGDTVFLTETSREARGKYENEQLQERIQAIVIGINEKDLVTIGNFKVYNTQKLPQYQTTITYAGLNTVGKKLHKGILIVSGIIACFVYVPLLRKVKRSLGKG